MKMFVFVAALSVPYLIAASLPASVFWYEPGEVYILDADSGSAPAIKFTRNIKREAGISYAVVVRNIGGETSCEGRGGPFTYKPMHGPLIGKDLVWWASGDQRCARLPVGTYWGETCWSIVAPMRDLLPGPLKDVFGWILPPKHVCRVTLPFTVS